MSLNAKLDTFGAKVSQEAAIKRADRKVKWVRIKAEAPEMAEFFLEINAAFGKPERSALWIGDERVL